MEMSEEDDSQLCGVKRIDPTIHGRLGAADNAWACINEVSGAVDDNGGGRARPIRIRWGKSGSKENDLCVTAQNRSLLGCGQTGKDRQRNRDRKAAHAQHISIKMISNHSSG
jgi:hypothetical protein